MSGANKDRLAFFSLGLDAFAQVGGILGAKDVALQCVLVQRATCKAVEVTLHALDGQGRHVRQMVREPVEFSLQFFCVAQKLVQNPMASICAALNLSPASSSLLVTPSPRRET